MENIKKNKKLATTKAKTFIASKSWLRRLCETVPCKLKIKAEKGIQRRNDGERSLLKIELGKTGVFGLGEFRLEKWLKSGGERLKILYFESIMWEQTDFKLSGVSENKNCVRNLGEKSNFRFLLRIIFTFINWILKTGKMDSEEKTVEIVCWIGNEK